MRANDAELLEPPQAPQARGSGDRNLGSQVAQTAPVVALQQSEELPVDAIQSYRAHGGDETNAKFRGLLVSRVSTRAARIVCMRARALSGLELLIGIAIVLGHNVWRVLPNEVF